VLLLLMLASEIAETYSRDMGDGMTAFYMGGVAYIAFERARSPQWEAALRVLLAALWPFTIYYVWSGGDMSYSRVWWLRESYAIYILFPCTVLYFALREARAGAPARSFSWLGEISYSSYLLHFPLMLFIAIVLKRTGIAFTIALSPAALTGFLVLLVLVSLASYRFFERPVQDWLRARWRSGKAVAPVPQVAS
jgi:peptidoglycan/LPS O-acetylase OafA/YrhL